MSQRIVILGGGFAGLNTALHLGARCRKRADVQITLICRDNYFQMTPLLFEAGSGVLEPRHAVNPIRPMFPKKWNFETQIVAFILSGDQQNDADVLAVCGASLSLLLSEIPFPEAILNTAFMRIWNSIVLGSLKK